MKRSTEKPASGRSHSLWSQRFLPLTSLLLALVTLITGVHVLSGTEKEKQAQKPVKVHSLRGPTPIPEDPTPPSLAKFPKERIRPALQYIGQPPLIPHSIRGYEINLNGNKCLMCHSWENAVKMKATRISPTHFIDRNGNVLADVAPGRYICNNCHVPQANAKPLIQNIFEPVESLK